MERKGGRARPLGAAVLLAAALALVALNSACASPPAPTPAPTIFPTPTPFPVRSGIVKFATEITAIEKEREAWKRGWDLFSKNIRDYTSPALPTRYQALRRQFDPLLERLQAVSRPNVPQAAEIHSRFLATYNKEREALDAFESLLLTKNTALLDQVASMETEAARLREMARGEFSGLLQEYKISAAEINP